MPPNAVDQSLETRCEVELSFFKDTVLVYQAYERWVQAAHRYITVLSEADNDKKTVNEIVHLVAAGTKKYTSCMSVLVERGKTITLLPFVIRGIDSNSAAAQISKMFSVEMSTKGTCKDVPEPESAVLHQQAIEYAEAHQDRTLTTEERTTYLSCVMAAERWQNEGLLHTDDLPHDIYMLGLAEDSPEEKGIRAILKSARKSLDQVLKMEDLRLRQMSQIVSVSGTIDEEYKKAMEACKEGKEWDHYLGVVLADARSPIYRASDEDFVKIVRGKTVPLRKTLRSYNKLQKKEQKLVYAWGDMLDKIRAANTARGDALKDLF
ncbi:MAG: hypothetical protein M1836_004361 [Candelina mexicana]|nr:MAG: hypothetical protein M1836_004361 [Candelina mexicana]